MSSNDLFDYMRDATQDMQSEYQRIQKRTLEDPGTAGDNGEENWAELLRKWLPNNYHIVTKGRIMNTKGDCGPQVDVLVLSPSYPEALIGKKEYLEGGVLAAFECKLTLRSEHVRVAVQNAVKIARLSGLAREVTLYREVCPRILYGLLAHSHSWRRDQSAPIDKIEEHLRKTEAVEVKHPRELLDMICISDLASWNTWRSVNTGAWAWEPRRGYYLTVLPQFWEELQASGGFIETIHTCYDGSFVVEADRTNFTPIGSFLCAFIKKLAWKDPGLRPLADYFALVGLDNPTIYEGTNRKLWPLTVLSRRLVQKVREENPIIRGDPWRGEPWNEWRSAF